MAQIDLCINTQTPPLSPRAGAPPPDGRTWRLGRDYVPQLGGVIPMMRALLRAGMGSWIRRPARWIALGTPALPKEVATDEGYIFESVTISEPERRRYSRFKEAIWRSFHGPRGFAPSDRDYPGFLAYTYHTADRLLSEVADHDLFYVNDFQQILTGGLIGPSSPALLHWHIPLDFRGYPEPVSRFFLKSMEGFDGMVVSTRAGLESLIQVGYHGRAFQVYPFIDPAEKARPTTSEVSRFAAEHGLEEGPVLVSVGRMDPMKRQDILLEALPRIRRRHPGTRCVIVGGSSFSTGTAGLGSTKGTTWRRHLEARAKALGISSHVVFTGTASPRELATAYAAADVFVHPAPWEGFGLVGIEAWMYGRPIVVSRGAGVAELVNAGMNGFTTPPGQSSAIADRVVELLNHPDRAERMGSVGAETARRCYVDRAAPRLREIIERTIELYERSGVRAGRRSRGWRP
ncbi:MAG TPA: glycosyltransferase family 4 protein [Thermoplasmata archaeon]|nr:glycosyltransferase family 4 protein [Thermoplasmata archaeon]